MKRFSLAIAILLPLCACSGGGSTSGPLPQGVLGVPSGSLDQTQAVSESRFDAVRFPQYVSSSADLLYVANTGNNSITVYRRDSWGDSPPLRVIAGSKTGIDRPGQLSEDAQGNLYVANDSIAHPAILVFARGVEGNVAPIRKLAGSATGLTSAVQALTVDQTTGKIFAVDYSSGSSFGFHLLRFAPNASGNVAPFASSSAALPPAYQLASDSTGNNVIEAYGPVCCNASAVGAETFTKQFANNAVPASPYIVGQLPSAGVADDPTTKTYLTTTPGGIYRLAESTIGSGPFGKFGMVPEHLTPAHASIITSDTCGSQIAIGYLRNIYVTHGRQSGCATDAVYVYTHDAAGNAAPLHILGGSATRLDQPTGIYEGQ